MNIMSLFNALPGACAQGLIWGIMAIGVYITYKILDLADLTVDGTMATGGAVCIMMIRAGHSIGISLLFAVLAGALVLHQIPTGRELAGCVLMFVAIVLAQRE